MAVTAEQPVFTELDGDDIKPEEIESLCVECGENGITRLMLTKIPHYKEVILMSFNCEHCHATNNEIQSGGAIQEKGVRLTVTIGSERDLCRQVVKSDSARLLVPAIDLEIPATSQRGEVSTVEGVLLRTVAGLEQDQPVRRVMHPEDAASIDRFVERLQHLLTVSEPFTLTLEDPSGNSFIENPSAPGPDPGRTSEHFLRTEEQNNMLGLYGQQEDTALTAERLHEEVLTFQTNCHSCNSPADTNMKMTNIPYFKEVVIMCTTCDRCGVRTNEVKSGGGMEAQGKRITLRVTDKSDLCRDVLKSDTCSLALPDLDFEIGGAAVGGKFTTLEGMLTDTRDAVEKNSFWGCGGVGDAVAPDIAERMKEFRRRLDEFIVAKVDFTVVLDDPAGNSYLQNVYAPEEDPELKVENYDRTFDQNEELGLNDMKVEGYEDEER
jgi:zinc finger protein